METPEFELKTTVQRYYDGDRLTTAELDGIIAFSRQMAELKWILPDRFYLFTEEFRKINAECVKWKLIRKERTIENPGHEEVHREPATDDDGPTQAPIDHFR